RETRAPFRRTRDSERAARRDDASHENAGRDRRHPARRLDAPAAAARRRRRARPPRFLLGPLGAQPLSALPRLPRARTRARGAGARSRLGRARRPPRDARRRRRRPRELRAPARPPRSRGRVHRRRRVPGSRDRHAPARAARRRGSRGRHRGVRCGGPAGQPQHARRLPQRRLRRGARARVGVDRGAVPDRGDAPLPRAGRSARPRRGARVAPSPRRGSIGGELFRNILDADFAGAAYPVNRGGAPVAGVRGYDSVAAIPDAVDFVVIALPGELVLDAAAEALEAGVKALCVISAGFAETGPAGRVRQDELLALVRSHGARLVGPNCLGVASAAVSMNATFAPRAFPAGSIGFSSQSGALGLALLERAEARGLGLSAFVSIGNKADVSSNDLLEWWEDDDRT